MLDPNTVIERTALIESLLRDRGASGRGLHEMLDSIEGELHEDVVRHARRVASIRNKVIHPPKGYRPSERDEQVFLEGAQYVIDTLGGSTQEPQARTWDDLNTKEKLASLRDRSWGDLSPKEKWFLAKAGGGAALGLVGVALQLIRTVGR